jgi:hypothetical protein
MKKSSIVGALLIAGGLVASASLWYSIQRVTSGGTELTRTESAGGAILTSTNSAVRVEANENQAASGAAPDGSDRPAATRRGSIVVRPLRLTPIPAGVPLDALARPEAMPGFGGFDLPPTFSEVVARMESEGVDPDWSSGTEARILADTSSLADQSVVSIDTECRATVCGLLIVHSRPDVEFELPAFAHLSERLDAQSPLVHTGFAQDGTRFTAIYFGRRAEAAAVVESR